MLALSDITNKLILEKWDLSCRIMSDACVVPNPVSVRGQHQMHPRSTIILYALK